MLLIRQRKLLKNIETPNGILKLPYLLEVQYMPLFTENMIIGFDYFSTKYKELYELIGQTPEKEGSILLDFFMPFLHDVRNSDLSYSNDKYIFYSKMDIPVIDELSVIEVR